MQFCNPGDPKGGAIAQCPPPKYAPVYASVTLIQLFILTLLQLCYLWYIITILVLKFILILPVFYYYVTPNFFLLSTYFSLTLYMNFRYSSL